MRSTRQWSRGSARIRSRFRALRRPTATPSGPGPRCRPGWPTRSARRSGRSSTRTDAVRRLHPLSVLPLEVPVLRLRLARRGGDPAAALHRRGPPRAARACGAISPSRGRLHLLRRRNALLVGPAPARQGPGEIRALWRVRPDAEVTLEANPGTTDEERFTAFRELGVNRLSIGVQSFAPAQLV